MRRFQHRSLIYTRLLHFFVLRVPVDQSLWLLSTQEALSAQARRRAALPLHVEELKMNRGNLYFERDERGNGLIAYRSEEATTTSAPRFTFEVYIDPAAPNIEPMTLDEFSRAYPNIVRKIPGFMAETSEGDLIVRSDFWRLKELQLLRDEMDAHYHNATSMNAGPRPVLQKRPFKEVATELIGDDILSKATSLFQAQTDAAEDERAEAFMLGQRHHEQQTRDPVSRGGSGSGPTTRQLARMKFGRPDMYDDVAGIREDMVMAHIPVPVASQEAKDHSALLFQGRVFSHPFTPPPPCLMRFSYARHSCLVAFPWKTCKRAWRLQRPSLQAWPGHNQVVSPWRSIRCNGRTGVRAPAVGTPIARVKLAPSTSYVWASIERCGNS